MLKWIKLISPADILTLLNGILGFIAITYIIDGNFLFASFLIFVSILMDRLDGFVARRYLSKHTKGRYLDSISDTVSFCFAPALLIYSSFFNNQLGPLYSLLVTVSSALVFAFGLMRLVRFSRKGYLLKNFSGVPTPATAFFAIVISLLFGKAQVLNGYSLPVISFQPLIALPLIIFISFMMLVNIEFPKMRLRMRYIFSIAFLSSIYCGVMYYLYTAGTPAWYTMLTGLVYLMLGIILAYLIIGPIYIKLTKKKPYEYSRTRK